MSHRSLNFMMEESYEDLFKAIYLNSAIMRNNWTLFSVMT